MPITLPYALVLHDQRRTGGAGGHGLQQRLCPEASVR